VGEVWIASRRVGSPARGRKASIVAWLPWLPWAVSSMALFTTSKCLPRNREPSSLQHHSFGVKSVVDR